MEKERIINVAIVGKPRVKTTIMEMIQQNLKVEVNDPLELGKFEVSKFKQTEGGICDVRRGR